LASVAFEHVDKLYPGGVAAVSDLCLDVADGELVAIVGPSGCGKSTLLRLLAGLEEPTRGTLRIGGREVGGEPPQARNVAMVFQDYALYPTMSVRDNLGFPLRMRGLRGAELRARVERVAELLALAPLLDRLPRQLSGGERQRVAMGRALVREPAAFLLDEPLSNLDAVLRVQVRAEIGELQRRTGATMLYVTHDQAEAMTLGQRVAVLRGGRLQQLAPPRELYARPANAFVAGFIGSPPMNLLPSERAAVLGVAALAAGATTLGVRPEAVRVLEGAARGGSSARASVLHVEYLGHETLAHLALAGADAGSPALIARLADGRRLTPGDTVALAVAPADVHRFDAEGRAVAAASGA
jgi:ABC-type sugar transport system ATPase subunit